MAITAYIEALEFCYSLTVIGQNFMSRDTSYFSIIGYNQRRHVALAFFKAPSRPSPPPPPPGPEIVAALLRS